MKEKILKSVKRLVRIKGFGFTMADVAKEVRISKNTLYQNYESKEEIIKCIIIEMKEESNAMQKELIADESLNNYEKMKRILVMLPNDYDLINPITLNQLEMSFPNLFKFVQDIYTQDWDRFEALYQESFENGEVEEVDVEFFRDLYVCALTHLPSSRSSANYSHRAFLEKLVDQLFDGVKKVC